MDPGTGDAPKMRTLTSGKNGSLGASKDAHSESIHNSFEIVGLWAQSLSWRFWRCRFFLRQIPAHLFLSISLASKILLYTPQLFLRKYQKWPHLKGVTFFKPPTHELGGIQRLVFGGCVPKNCDTDLRRVGDHLEDVEATTLSHLWELSQTLT